MFFYENKIDFYGNSDFAYAYGSGTCQIRQMTFPMACEASERYITIWCVARRAAQRTFVVRLFRFPFGMSYFKFFFKKFFSSQRQRNYWLTSNVTRSDVRPERGLLTLIEFFWAIATIMTGEKTCKAGSVTGAKNESSPLRTSAGRVIYRICRTQIGTRHFCHTHTFWVFMSIVKVIR